MSLIYDGKTIRDTLDNTKEEVSREFYNKLSEIVNIIDLSEESILLQKMLGIDIIIFDENDTYETALNKIENIKKDSKVKVYNLSNITDMCEMFAYCEATSLDLSSFDTSKVINMGSMFRHCKATSLDISNFDTSKVTDMHYMFESCQVTTLDLSSFDTSKVTDMSCMFYMCQATSLDLSSFDISNVGDMQGIFEGCYVTKIKLKKSQTKFIDKIEDKSVIEYVG